MSDLEQVKSETINANGITAAGVQLSTTETNKRWLTPLELQAEYGFTKSTQAKMRMVSTSSTIPFSKIGKFIRYDRFLIDEWLEQHQAQGVAS